MRPMTRADDLIPFQGAFGERCTIVGADVLDGVIVPLEIKYRDLHVIDTKVPAGQLADRLPYRMHGS